MSIKTQLSRRLATHWASRLAFDTRRSPRCLASWLRSTRRSSTTPIHVLIERPACVNMVIIDTPGLGGDDAIAKKAETLVASMSSPGRRYLCVEAAAPQWQPSLLRAVVSALDPRGTRTTFVYTMAHIQLRNFVTYDQAARYFRLCPAPRAIFVDSLSRGTRDADHRRRHDAPAHRAGAAAAERHVPSLRHRSRKSTASASSALLDEMHRCGVQDLEHQMPAILDAHRAQLGALRNQLATIMLEQDSLEPHLLRAAATRWAGSFGQSLLDGVQRRGGGAGQTLDEERAASGIAWSTAPGSPVPVPAADVEESRTRLLGVQQLHRLTHDFRAACAKIALTAAQVSADDVNAVVAAGPPSAYQRALAAAEIASRHALKLYGPLVAQLFERAVAIVDRLPDVAFDAAVRGGGLDGRRLIDRIWCRARRTSTPTPPPPPLPPPRRTRAATSTSRRSMCRTFRSCCSACAMRSRRRCASLRSMRVASASTSCAASSSRRCPRARSSACRSSRTCSSTACVCVRSRTLCSSFSASLPTAAPAS
jgi:hypothetical protein